MQKTRRARLTGLLLLLVTLNAAPVVSADVVGVFTEVEGQVTFLRDDYYFAAAEGVEVEDEDLVDAAADSSTQIEMVDGSILRLASNTRLLLSEYRVAESKNVIAASLEVLSGWLRFAVAKLRKDAKYEFNTPTLAIGVRGTEGVIEAENEQGGLFLEEGLVEVTAQDQQAGKISAVRVAAGEYIERRRGAPFRRLRQPSTAFRNRLPARLRRRVERRIGSLVGRRVAPRVLRRINQDDVRRYLRQHAPMRQRLERRLKRSQQPGARSLRAPLRSQGHPTQSRPMPQRHQEAVDRLIRRSRLQRERQSEAMPASEPPAHARQRQSQHKPLDRKPKVGAHRRHAKQRKGPHRTAPPRRAMKRAPGRR